MDREFEFKRRNNRGIENLITRVEVEEQENGQVLNLTFDDLRYSNGVLTLFPTSEIIEQYRTKGTIPSEIFGIELHDKKDREEENHLTQIHYANGKITKAYTTYNTSPENTIYEGFGFLQDLSHAVIKERIGCPELRSNLSHIVGEHKTNLILSYLYDQQQQIYNP